MLGVRRTASDGKELAGCPAAMANFIIKKIKESEEKYNEPAEC